MSVSSPSPRRRSRLLASLALPLVAAALAVSGCSKSSTPTPNANTGRPSGSSTTPKASGSATPSSSTSSQGSAAAGSLVNYSLAPGIIDLGTPGYNVIHPTQVAGVLAMPSTPGLHPVVVIVPGTHLTCGWKGKDGRLTADAVTISWPLVCESNPKKPYVANGVEPDYVRTDTGLSYLAESLAKAGFVAVAVDISSTSNLWAGEPSIVQGREAIVKTHLALLKDLNAGNDHGLGIAAQTKGRIDLSKIGLVGHSNGGEYVLSADRGTRQGLFVQVALEPTDTDAISKSIVPTLLVRGGCDEDVSPTSGLETAHKLAAQPGRTKAPVVDALVPGAGHAMLNTALRAEKALPEGCKPGQVVKPEAARAEVAALVTSFITAAAKGQPYTQAPSVDGLKPQVKGLVKGAAPITVVTAQAETFTPATKLPVVESTQGVLPAIPKGFKVDKNPKY